jgi:Domain of Unknown Function (DUF1080)
MKFFILVLKFSTALLLILSFNFSSAQNVVTQSLLNGKDLTGWKLIAQTKTPLSKACQVDSAGILHVVGKPVGYLLYDKTFINYHLHVEWRWPVNAAKNSNSGVLVHISSGPLDRNTWPLCFQFQTKLSRAGDILPMAGAVFHEALSTPANAKTPQLDRMSESSEKPLGEWNSYDIECTHGEMSCTVNGVKQNHVTQANPASGQIGIQLEGTPYDLRNITLKILP